MNLNQVMLIGNLVEDPELKETQGGRPYCRVSVATNYDWKDKEGNKNSEVTYHPLIIWGDKAATFCQWMSKGCECLFWGRLQNNNYEKDGVKHYQMQISVDKFQFGNNPKKKDETATQEDPF